MVSPSLPKPWGLFLEPRNVWQGSKILLIINTSGITVDFLPIQDTTDQKKLLEALSNLQERSKQVNLGIDFPIEDSSITEKQFDRCLHNLVRIADGCYPRLQTILATGDDPDVEPIFVP